jgi:hypothetical protein
MREKSEKSIEKRHKLRKTTGNVATQPKPSSSPNSHITMQNNKRERQWFRCPECLKPFPALHQLVNHFTKATTHELHAAVKATELTSLCVSEAKHTPAILSSEVLQQMHTTGLALVRFPPTTVEPRSFTRACSRLGITLMTTTADGVCSEQKVGDKLRLLPPSTEVAFLAAIRSGEFTTSYAKDLTSIPQQKLFPDILQSIATSHHNFISLLKPHTKFYGVISPYWYIKTGDNAFCLHFEQVCAHFINACLKGKQDRSKFHSSHSLIDLIHCIYYSNLFDTVNRINDVVLHPSWGQFQAQNACSRQVPAHPVARKRIILGPE